MGQRSLWNLHKIDRSIAADLLLCEITIEYVALKVGSHSIEPKYILLLLFSNISWNIQELLRRSV